MTYFCQALAGFFGGTAAYVALDAFLLGKYGWMIFNIITMIINATVFIENAKIRKLQQDSWK